MLLTGAVIGLNKPIFLCTRQRGKFLHLKGGVMFQCPLLHWYFCNFYKLCNKCQNMKGLLSWPWIKSNIQPAGKAFVPALLKCRLQWQYACLHGAVSVTLLKWVVLGIWCQCLTPNVLFSTYLPKEYNWAMVIKWVHKYRHRKLIRAS